MKKFLAVALLACSALGLSNCADLDPLPWTQNDVFITTKYSVDSSLVHGLSIYSRSNKRLSSSTCASPNDSVSYEMNPYNANQPYEFTWNTTDENMTSSLPSSGVYRFKALTASDSEEITGSDVLKKQYLLPTQVAICAFDSINSKLNIAWRAVNDCDYSILMILRADGKEVYASRTLAATDTAEVVSKTNGNWLAPGYQDLVEGTYEPTDGEKLTLQISSFKKDAGDSNEVLLDARSITTYDFIWKDPIEIIIQE